MPNVNPMASRGKSMESDVMSDGQQWATGSKIPSVNKLDYHYLLLLYFAVAIPAGQY